jgi:glutaredoxin
MSKFYAATLSCFVSLLIAQRVIADRLPVLLSATWCPVCAAAKEFLAEQGEPFEVLDIESSKEGRRLFAQSHALGPPVLYVDGEFYTGFDPLTWQRVLRKHSQQSDHQMSKILRTDIVAAMP